MKAVFFDLNLRKKVIENGNEPSVLRRYADAQLSRLQNALARGTFLQSEKEQHIYEMLLDM